MYDYLLYRITMKQILLWLWCLPQNLVGLLVMLFTKAKRVGDHYEFNVPFGSVSLGEFIFLCKGHSGNDEVLRHEKGHRTQSRMLGWLYLIVIALPSCIWAGCFGEYRKKKKRSYYSFYTEAWADKLAGITRNETNDHL